MTHSVGVSDMWRLVLFKVTLPFALAVLTACSSDNANNDDNVVAPLVSRISGNVQFANNVVVDSDLDANSFQASNDTTDLAQLLQNNRVQVQGSVSELGEPGENVADVQDVYRVFLQEGQTVTLDVVDRSQGSVRGAELELSVIDVAFARSVIETVGEFQTIQVEADAEYFITVSAVGGVSKYVLTLGEVTPESLLQSFLPTSTRNTTTNDTLGAPLLVETTETQRFQLSEAIVRWTSASSGWEFETVALKDLYPNTNLDWSQESTTMAAVDHLRQRDDVEYAELNYYRKPLALVPTDPLYGSPLEAPLFRFENGSLDLSQSAGSISIDENSNGGLVVGSSFISQYHYEQINLPEAWELIMLETGKMPGENVIVAVSDTGLFLSHDDLVNKLTNDGFDFISNALNARDGESDGIEGDIDSNPDDPGDGADIGSSSWHGTHVAGTIAAETNNGIGGAGIAWETRIMPLRVLGRNGGTSADIMNSLIYAADLFTDLKPAQPADVINLSLGGVAPSRAEQNIIDAVRAAGTFIVAAAGNDGNSTLSFPASYEGVISVAAINGRKQRARFSQFNDQVDVAAPGGEILGVNGNLNLAACVGVLSSFVAESNNGIRESSNNCLQGTSMSAPHVSGVIALMKSVHPELTPDEFDTLLSQGEITDDLGIPGRDDEFGNGLINAEKAVRAALNLAADQPLQNPLLAVSSETIVLSDVVNQASLDLRNINSDTVNPSVSVDVSSDWIKVDSSQTDNGIGNYQISADTSGFGAGQYTGLIRFTPDRGNQLDVVIQLTVGTVQNNHPQASHFVLFINDAGENTAAVQVQSDGSFTTELEHGEYRVVSGSDINVDFILCQVGETCSASASLVGGQLLTLNSDRTDLDLTVQLLESGTSQPTLFDSSIIQEEHGAFAIRR